MKKLILSIILIFSALIVPAAGHCDYAIHLKNGGRFTTSQYWEKNNEIRFFSSGGVVGIEKNFVRKIEKLPADPYRNATIRTPEKRPAQVEPKASMPSVPEKEGKETATDDAKKDPTIMGEFKALEKKFELRNSITVAELTDLKNDLTVLRDKIFSNRLKYDSLEEANKVAEMRFLVNDLLIIKSKNP